VLIWRLLAERHAHDPRSVERLVRRAHQFVDGSLFALAAFITFDAVTALIGREVPERSTVGIVLTTISIGVMLWLGRAKRRAAAALNSRAMAADAFQTTGCWWLSVAALCGLGLNASLGWWWADSVAALVMAALIVREGRKAWRGEHCCRRTRSDLLLCSHVGRLGRFRIREARRRYPGICESQVDGLAGVRDRMAIVRARWDAWNKPMPPTRSGWDG
jgi:hypothetical protein